MYNNDHKVKEDIDSQIDVAVQDILPAVGLVFECSMPVVFGLASWKRETTAPSTAYPTEVDKY